MEHENEIQHRWTTTRKAALVVSIAPGAMAHTIYRHVENKVAR